MAAIVRLVACALLVLGVLAYLDAGIPGSSAALLAALGLLGLALGAAAARYARYRRAFAKARKGARRAAREARREGRSAPVPRSREWLAARALLPGARGRARAARERIAALVAPHAPELAVQRERSLRVEYGREDRGRWDRHLADFIARTVLPAARPGDLDLAAPYRYRWHRDVAAEDARTTRHGRWAQRMYCQPGGALPALVEELVDAYVASPEYREIRLDAAAATPDEYELHCARVLRLHGWDARVVGGAGDQGADVVAARGRFRVAVQCKLVARPVGNGAVQEVIAGKAMHHAQAAAVVSPARYTRSAQDLARLAKVVLLHDTELPLLDERLRAAGVAVPPPPEPAGAAPAGDAAPGAADF
ncbi:MAG TPA: restriction endonuclease [Longimicrobium sp.]|nr:restriction endonuclease [Longimicrobium sp.]